MVLVLKLLALVILLAVVKTDLDDVEGGGDTFAVAASIDSAVTAISLCTDCFLSLICNAASSRGLGAKFSSGICKMYANNSEDDGHLINR